MPENSYHHQVSLLIDVLPEIEKEECLAIHGGTAINLFVRNMPRLSVDIDLTYIHIEERDDSLQKISHTLSNIKNNLEAKIQGVSITHNEKTAKLFISNSSATVKLEVNLTKRGILGSTQKKAICAKAQSEFEKFCEVSVVSTGELYGGKICAALDRQHPRDLFDIKYLLDNEGITEDIKRGFIYYLICSDRPIEEVLDPNLKDQESVLESQFEGMTKEPFSYDDFMKTREKLIKEIKESLNNDDKAFLMSFKNVEPDWNIYDFSEFPAVKWKLMNLAKLKENNIQKHKEQVDKLKNVLE